jgi:transposase InsO family protein
LKRVQALFAWPGLHKDVKQFMASCLTCQQAKPERVKYPGLLQPLSVPSSAWQVISMDFVEELPVSHGQNCILVVVDLFSKYSHFIGLKHPFTALSVAKLFMLHVYKLHGLPTAIISDRDRIFTSQLWQELFRLAGVELCISSAYHPQSDGQTEHVNQSMEAFLRCFANAVPTKMV